MKVNILNKFIDSSGYTVCPAINEAIRNAVIMWHEGETRSVAEAFRRAGATDNQHNRGKFEEMLKQLNRAGPR